MKRHGGFGMISHVTPIVVPVFIVLWYAPFIAGWLQTQGWPKGFALGTGLLLPTLWLVVGNSLAFTIPTRFAKLKGALEWVMYGVPVLGMLALLFWTVVSAVWRLAN